MPPKKTAKKTRAAKRSARFARAAAAAATPTATVPPRGGRRANAAGAARGDDDAEFGARAGKTTSELAVVEMIATTRGPARDIMAKVHDLIMDAVPDLEPAIKWGMPVYSKDGMVCYLAPYDAYVRFGFYHARSLGLEGLDAGQGDGGHVKYAKAADVDAARVKAWVQKAVRGA